MSLPDTQSDNYYRVIKIGAKIQLLVHNRLWPQNCKKSRFDQNSNETFFGTCKHCIDLQDFQIKSFKGFLLT